MNLPTNGPLLVSIPVKYVLLRLSFCGFLLFTGLHSVAVTKTSTGSGSWSTEGTWSPGGVPTALDDVIITAGHSITVSSDPLVLSLTVHGNLTIGTNPTDRIVTVSGNVLISVTGSITTVGNGGNEFRVGGQFTNNGIYDAWIGGATMITIFNGTANQTLSGSGSTNEFDAIVLQNAGASGNNIVEITSTNFSASPSFLTLTAGIFKVSGTFTITNSFMAAGYSVPAGAGFWLNNPNATVVATAASPTISGLLRIDQGSYRAGTTAAHTLRFREMIVNGGSLTCSGALWSAGATSAYTQTAGTVLVAAIGNSSAYSSFQFTGSSFTMSGGSIILQQIGATDYFNNASTRLITGGVLQVGNASSSAGSIYLIGGFVPALDINATTNIKTVWLSNAVYIYRNLTIGTGSRLLCYNGSTGTGYTAVFYGNAVVNNGSIEGNATAARFGFYGSTLQTYGGTGTFGTLAAPFSSGVDIANNANVQLNSPVISSRFNLFYGTFINSNQITVGNGSIGIVQRGGTAGYNAGSFDVSPNLNTGSNYVIRYDDANAVTTGFEIPASRTAATVYCNNPQGLTLSGGDLTVNTDLQLVAGNMNIGSQMLHLSGTLTKTAGFINGVAGSVNMTGATGQTIPAATFLNNTLQNLTISNTSATAPQVTLGGSLNLTGTLSFGNVNSKTLNTAGFLTLKSSASATARVADLTNGGANTINIITGNVTVERHLVSGRKWRYLSVPTNDIAQTFKAAWQEGAAALANPNPGYGFIIGDIVAPSVANGYDLQTISGPVVKTYSLATNSYTGIPGTNTTIKSLETALGKPHLGYMTFVGGDRSVTAYNQVGSTTIRSKGALYTGNQPVTVAAGEIRGIGNPYASPVNMITLLNPGNPGNNLVDAYQVWDPKRAGLGAFQAMVWDGVDFLVVPGGGSYGTSGTPHNSIESGQGFFVHGEVGTATILFTEAAKSLTATAVNFTEGMAQQLFANLYSWKEGGSPVLADGCLAEFDPAHTKAVDGRDVRKLQNTNESFYIFSNGSKLIVERRPVVNKTDTIQLHMHNLAAQRYQLEFILKNMDAPGRQAFLVDQYLHSSTPLEMAATSLHPFMVTADVASAATDRFLVVFETLNALPVTFTDLKAKRTGATLVNGTFEVAQELNVQDYEVQAGNNGRDFEPIATIPAMHNNGNTAHYNFQHLNAPAPTLYYRVKARSIDSQLQYSETERVDPLAGRNLFSVYLNPVEGNILQLQPGPTAKGRYTYSISNAAGQVLQTGQFVNSTNQLLQILLPDQMAAGGYQLVISSELSTTISLSFLKR